MLNVFLIKEFYFLLKNKDNSRGGENGLSSGIVSTPVAGSKLINLVSRVIK